MESSSSIPALSSRYQQAQTVLQGAFTKNAAFNTTLYPHWIGDSDCFWYLRDLSPTESEYRMVDAASADNRLAFDHDALAASLSAASKRMVDPKKLPIADVEMLLSPLRIYFSAFDQQWQFDAEAQRCEPIDALPKLGHASNGYTIRRSWNYFVEHLLGEEPPKDFKLKTGIDLMIEAMNKEAGKT